MPVLNLYDIDYSYWDILDFFRENNFVQFYLKMVSEMKKGN